MENYLQASRGILANKKGGLNLAGLFIENKLAGAILPLLCSSLVIGDGR